MLFQDAATESDKSFFSWQRDEQKEEPSSKVQQNMNPAGIAEYKFLLLKTIQRSVPLLSTIFKAFYYVGEKKLNSGRKPQQRRPYKRLI